MKTVFSVTPTFALLLCAVATFSCAPKQGGMQAPGDVKCPEGQTFDGKYCRVDQSVATVETPVSPSPAEPSQPAPQAAEPTGAQGELPPAAVGSTGESPAGESPAETSGDVPVDAEDGLPEEAQGEGEPSAVTKATPVDYAMAAQAAPVMQYLASSHLPRGARALGPPFAGQFEEGQVLEQKVQLQAGKCYTVVAMALPPVTELNVELFAEDRDETLLAEDSGSGPQAVLGSRDTCFQSAESGPARLVLTVEQGRGVAAAQVFQK